MNQILFPMEIFERLRRCKRCLDSLSSFRKAFLLLTFLFAVLLYLGPWFFNWLSPHKGIQIDAIQQCLSNHVETVLKEVEVFDAHVNIESSLQSGYLQFVGNGKIGLVIENDSPLYILKHRVLSLPVPFYPMISIITNELDSSEALVTSYTSGIVQKFECIKKNGYSIDVTHKFYAHRKIPSILVQDIKIINPLDEDVFLNLFQTGISDWSRITKVESSGINGATDGITSYAGEVQLTSGKKISVVILQNSIPKNIQVKRQSSVSLHILTVVQYDEIQNDVHRKTKDELFFAARQDMERGLSVNPTKFREDHAKVWNQMWSSGLSISHSKAADALNGDKINATIYFVLSHTRSLLNEVILSDYRRFELLNWLNEPDHCYAGLHTLEASKLWSDLKTQNDVANVVSLWKLTLEKQGCQTLMRAGADGVLQALILSFGAFKFSNHHVEFGMQPKYLHRDYLFRRISYGNGTHLNISVAVGENNKAVLYVVLDRSDKNYYACDGGCLDTPVQLSQEKQMFPVKLTDPPTSILYITSNKQHMEELKHAILVKEIVEAPAHEHHVIALHRHGHHFGGLPTMFWVSIAFLVAIFHLFLFKLIYSEYCASQEKFRTRHSL